MNIEKKNEQAKANFMKIYACGRQIISGCNRQ